MATELAKAYVQIIPSAQGISGSIQSALGGEAESAGNSAGQSFGSNMIGIAKKLIAAAGIGKAIAASLSAGADLQQSLGGVETLFKENADTVKEYAANAYKTAGLSANDYMEVVTGFSASLLQGLDGDTAKAAQISDMAVTDMADNANKFGTDMDSIQMAYQGFAKQNYTMLDNLKLGYGGTKTEMQRLLADAQKISGVKYDMSNLSDVYSAIHVVQGELGVTGTTAKEAATTFSGSLASMKSAAQNVLANLSLGNDITPSLQELTKTASTFLVGNLLPMVWNIAKSIPGALVTIIQEGIPQMASAFMGFFTQLQSGFSSGLPQLLQSGTEMLNGVVDGFLSALPQLLTAAFSAITQFCVEIIQNLPQIIESGKSILMNFIGGISQALPEILTAAGTMMITLVSALITHLPEILAAGFDLVVSLISGIGNALPGIITAAGEVWTSFKSALEAVDWMELGKNIIRGLINGIGAMAGALWDAATNIAKAALNAIKGFFGIASPSKTMRDQVGKWIPAGIAVGIEKNTQPLTDAMQGLADMTTKDMQTSLSADAHRYGRSTFANASDNGGAPSVTQYIYAAKQTPVELAATTKAYFQKARWTTV